MSSIGVVVVAVLVVVCVVEIDVVVLTLVAVLPLLPSVLAELVLVVGDAMMSGRAGMVVVVVVVGV